MGEIWDDLLVVVVWFLPRDAYAYARSLLSPGVRLSVCHVRGSRQNE